MNKNKDIFSLYGSIRKYKGWAKMHKLCVSVKSIPVIEVFTGCSSHNEKLQIVYANIRV